MALTQISTGGVKNDAVTAGKIPANAVGSSEIADDAVGVDQIADDAVVQAAVADEAIDEARLQISNAGSNGQFLQKQSGNTGGLTWAAANQYTHPNHSGEVTSTADGAQVIASDVVDEDNLKISNSGTNGQFLQKQSGNTGGLTWADVTIPPAGNTFTAVANGAIANNKAVKLDSDGKVSEVGETTTSLSQLSYLEHTSTSINSSAVAHMQMLYHPTTQQVVAFWKNTTGINTNGSIKARVGTVASDGTLSWGSTESIGSSSQFRSFKVCYDPDQDHIVIAVHDDGYDRLIYSVYTVNSNKTLSGGTFYIFENSATSGDPRYALVGLEYDTNTNKYLVVYVRDKESGQNDKRLHSRVGEWTTSSGGYVSWGDDQVVYGSNISEVDYGDRTDMCFDSTANKMVLFTGMYHSSSHSGVIIEGTISSSSKSITWANLTTVESSMIHTPRLAHDASSGRTILLYFTNVSPAYVAFRSFKINSGSSPTLGGKAYLQYQIGLGQYYEASLVYDSGIQKCVVAYTWEATNNATYAAIRGATITSSSSSSGVSVALHAQLEVASFQTNEQSMWRGVYHPVAKKHVFSFYRLAASQQRTMTSSTQALTSNLTSGSTYVGFADQAYTNGQTATIKTYGNNISTLSGLTIGSKYWVKGDGTVTTTQQTGAGAALAGIAIGTNKLLIREPNSWVS